MEFIAGMDYGTASGERYREEQSLATMSEQDSIF